MSAIKLVFNVDIHHFHCQVRSAEVIVDIVNCKYCYSQAKSHFKGRV